MNSFSQNLARFTLMWPKDSQKIAEAHACRCEFPVPKEWFSSLDLQNVKVVYVYGISAEAYRQASQEWLKQSDRFLIFLEEDPNVIYSFLKTEEAARLLNDPQVRIKYFQLEDDQCWIDLAKIFGRFAFKLVPLKPCDQPDYMTAIHSKLSFWSNFQKYSHSEHANFGQHFYQNFYQNLLLWPQAYIGEGFYQKFKGVPAIICGAGPSLDKNLQLLSTLQDRALIFAGGTAMNAVNSAGVLPHFGLGIDPNPEQETRLIMNNAFEVPFLYRSRFNHQALAMLHNPTIYVSGSSLSKAPEWFEKLLNRELHPVEEGFNVINFSTSLACFMGCNPIIFVGVDMAYSDQKSYQSGVQGHPLHHKKDFRTKNPHEELLIKSDIFGNPVHTLWKWISEAAWYQRCAIQHAGTLFINATEGGIGMPGIPNKPLNEIVSYLLTQQYELISRVHGEMQNSSPPSSLTVDRVIESAKELSASFERCQICYQKRELASIQGEVAYQYILKDFEQFYENNQALEQQQINYNPNLTESEKQHKIDQLVERRHEMMRNTALAHQAMIHYLVLEQPRPNTIETGQTSSFSEVEVPSVDLEYTSSSNTLYANGKVKIESAYKNGKLHGPYRFFAENGQPLALCNYKDGLKQGPAYLFYASGSRYAKQNYKDGLLDGIQAYFYPNGQLKTQLFYCNNQLNGKAFFYYPDGTKKRELSFIDGKRHGFERMWDASGLLQIEAEYALNKPVRKARRWHANGQLAQEVIYDQHSEQVSSKHWNEHGESHEVFSDDYFDKVAKETNQLTRSLDNVFNHLNQIVPLLTSEPAIQADLNKLNTAMDHLHKTNEELLQESGLQAENPTEQLWKTPSNKEELEKQLKYGTEKLSSNILQVQQLIEHIKNRDLNDPKKRE